MARAQAGMLCNAASIEATGLVSVLGAFVDTVTAPVLPVRHQTWVVVRILWDDHDLGVPHNMSVSVLDPQGTVIASIGGPALVEAGEDTDMEMPPASMFAVPMLIEFPQVGIHNVVLQIDGTEIWSAPLRVRVELPPI